MLAISALSRNSRYVGAIWAALWLVTYVSSLVLIGLTRKPWAVMVSYVGNFDRLRWELLDVESALNQFAGLFRFRRDGWENQLLSYPWYWSAALLLALFGISVWILSFRVRTLDRLK